MKTPTEYGYGKALKISKLQKRKEDFSNLLKAFRIKKSAIIITILVLTSLFVGKSLIRKIVNDFGNSVTYVADKTPP